MNCLGLEIRFERTFAKWNNSCAEGGVVALSEQADPIYWVLSEVTYIHNVERLLWKGRAWIV